MVKVEAEVVAFEVGIFDDTFIVKITEGGVELGFVVAAAKGKVVFRSHGTLENVIPIIVTFHRVFVGDQGTGRVTSFDKFYTLGVQLCVGQAYNQQCGQTVLRSFQAIVPFFTKTLTDGGHRDFLAQSTGDKASRKFNPQFFSFASLGENLNHPVGGTSTVKGSC